jgi:two-component system response regulator FixJ
MTSAADLPAGDAGQATRPPVVYVVDDDESIRTLWRWLMESNGISVQVFESATEFIGSYRDDGPGCLVLDLRLPGMTGLELQDHLRNKGILIPIVFVSGHGDIATAVSAIKAGAIDFMQKPFSYRDALAIVKKAIERDAHTREDVRRRALAAARLSSLTDRERQVLQCVIDGKANKVIAAELEISTKTVEFHRSKVMEKLAADSVAELVHIALQHSAYSDSSGR